MNEFYFYRGMQINILNNYRSLDSGNLTSFLDENEYLDLSLALSYMTLSKDLIIDKDKKNKNPEERLTSSIDMKLFDYFFTKEFNEEIPTIYKSTGTSKRWIVDSIRDSIMHSQFEIDFDNKCFKINNKEPSRELACEVPFSWFKRYVDFHILENKKVTDINISDAFLNQDTYNNFNLINNKKELNDFLDNIVLYNINIKSKNPINERKIQREIKDYIDEKNYLNVKEEFKEKKYKQKWNIIKNDLKTYLQNNYPGIEISINEIDDKFLSQNIISLYNDDYNNLFKEQDKRVQYQEIKNRLTKYLKNDDTKVLDALENLISSRKLYQEEIKKSNDYEECKDVIFYILNAKNNGSKTLEFIHKYRIEKGLENTYDDNILGDYHLITIDNEDKFGISKFLESKYGFKPSSIQIKLSLLKEYNIDLYNKYSKRFDINNSISKEDMEFYNKKIIRVAEQLRSTTEKEKDLLELGMIYNLGINTYVINKEKVFDKKGYDDIDVKIKGYSNSEYEIFKENYKVVNNRIEKENKKINQIKKNNPNPSKNRDKKIQKSRIQIEKYNEILNFMKLEKENFIDFDGKIFKPTDKENTARITRNCLSHFNRINFISYDKRNLLLNDENGIIKCSIDNLFNFIVNDTFHNEMRNTYDIVNNISMVLRQENFMIPIEENKKEKEKPRIRL